MKTIWIVNYYTAPPQYISNPRHLEFAKRLINAGYRVRIFSSGFLRGKNIDLVPSGDLYANEDYNGIPYTHIKVRHYEGNGISRMISIMQFAWRVFRFRKHFEKPDVVLHNIHAPFDYPIVWCAKTLKAQYIAEAWDLWPHFFVTFGLISARNPIMKVAYNIEKKMYQAASDIIYTFEGGIDYLRLMGWTTETGGKISPDKVHYINNGIDLREFYENVDRYVRDDSDLNRIDKFKVVYLGSIKLVNNVQQLIDAAAFLKTNPKYSFLIYGNGEEKARLQQYCRDNHIDNVVFKEDWIPLKEVAYVVSQSSLNVMNYQRGFGLYGVSSGKMFQYMAAGKPILCNIKLSYSDITRHNIGIDRDLNTPEEYAMAIQAIANMSSEEYESMCARAKDVAKQFDYDVLSEKLIQIIES